MNVVALILAIVGSMIFLTLFLLWYSEPKWTDGKRHIHYSGMFIFFYAGLAGIACFVIALICWLSQHLGFTWK